MIVEWSGTAFHWISIGKLVANILTVFCTVNHGCLLLQYIQLVGHTVYLLCAILHRKPCKYSAQLLKNQLPTLTDYTQLANRQAYFGKSYQNPFMSYDQ